MSILLSNLPIGLQAVIVGYTINEPPIQLLEMGCVPGETICIDRIAPLGDPISLYILGYHLSLRKEYTDLILVELAK